MNYSRFETLRRPALDAFERRLEVLRRRPGELGYEGLENLVVAYRQLLHDHALARTRFPGTDLARRIGRLVLAGTHLLQRDTGAHLPSLGRFFSRSFPAAIHRSTPSITLMAVLFLAATLFGASLAAVDPTAGNTFLPPDVVEDLARGKLWTESIFAVTPGSVASSKIATNNLGVALTAWAGGCLAGLGAFYVVLLNGLMLGSVLATTARYGMAEPLLEFVAAHGPLELSLIVVSAAAGLGVGRALVEATDRPRAELLRAAGRDALIVLLGCLPWFVVLGFVEGYLSPSAEVAPALKVALGLLLEILFVAVAWNPAARSPAA